MIHKTFDQATSNYQQNNIIKKKKCVDNGVGHSNIKYRKISISLSSSIRYTNIKLDMIEKYLFENSNIILQY